jgi:hypothetical protein
MPDNGIKLEVLKVDAGSVYVAKTVSQLALVQQPWTARHTLEIR